MVDLFDIKNFQDSRANIWTNTLYFATYMYPVYPNL